MFPLIDTTLADRVRAADDPDASGIWPSARLQCLRDAGVFRWGLPSKFGGIETTPVESLQGYLELSRICLTTAFIMTQRDAACHRIAATENQFLHHQLLPALCAGEKFATVGISHLSTSRQHWSRPSVIATPTDNGFDLTGEVPWVTGAPHADWLVTGGTLDSGDQILVAIPLDRAGIQVAEPLRLLALNAACTGTVVLDRVKVATHEIIVGPIPHVMKIGATGGTGSLTTTAVSIGAASNTIDGLRLEAMHRPEVQPIVDSLAAERDRLQSETIQAVSGQDQLSDLRSMAEQLRFRGNSLALRAAQAYLCVAKGMGYITGHPAERALREALFFQVWSCPPQVTRETLAAIINSGKH
jgi:alkylation response protein AidB-like acyl-CoA dehydrogenase